MKKILIIIGVILTASFIAEPVSAQQSLQADQIEKVRQACQRQQVNLRNLQKRDTVLRINRGRLYDVTLRQTGAFVARLQANKVEAPKLIELDASMRQTFLRFKTDYDTYGNYLGKAIEVDCQATPTEFYGYIDAAASARVVIGQDVATFKSQLNEYIGAMAALRDTKYPVGQ